MSGVIRTRVGYAGGTTPNPAYYNLRDHTETIRIDYDPTLITYHELLDVFWNAHNPAIPASTQYRSIIFYHNDEQRAMAISTKAHREALIGKTLYTEIVPASDFYLAEMYHQKHQLRKHPDILDTLRAIYPDEHDLIASTSAARVNGYFGRDVTLAGLQAELEGLRLANSPNDELRDIAPYLSGRETGNNTSFTDT